MPVWVVVAVKMVLEEIMPQVERHQVVMVVVMAAAAVEAWLVVATLLGHLVEKVEMVQFDLYGQELHAHSQQLKFVWHTVHGVRLNILLLVHIVGLLPLE